MLWNTVGIPTAVALLVVSLWAISRYIRDCRATDNLPGPPLPASDRRYARRIIAAVASIAILDAALVALTSHAGNDLSGRLTGAVLLLAYWPITTLGAAVIATWRPRGLLPLYVKSAWLFSFLHATAFATLTFQFVLNTANH
ncbi:MAG: hypothetical protein R3B68_14875 [Phycisphaerales bacterium]